MLGTLKTIIVFTVGVVLFVLIICGTAFGLTVGFNSPVISALAGFVVGWCGSYALLRRMKPPVHLVIAVSNAIGGLLLPWFVFFRGGGQWAAVDGICLSAAVTFVCACIGLLALPRD